MSDPSSNAPVAWFVDPQGQNAPNPGAEVHIYEGAQPQTGQGPVGQAWTPQQQQPAAGEAQPTTQDAKSNLFPSSRPLKPQF